MRTARLFGKDIYLTEKQWSQLVRRFDVDKTKRRKYGSKFEIRIGCFCCDFPCRHCPLNVLRWGDTYGCIRVVNYLCGTSNWAFNLTMDAVSWYEGEDKTARRQIQKVYTALMCMRKVKYVKKD